MDLKSYLSKPLWVVTTVILLTGCASQSTQVAGKEAVETKPVPTTEAPAVTPIPTGLDWVAMANEPKSFPEFSNSITNLIYLNQYQALDALLDIEQLYLRTRVSGDNAGLDSLFVQLINSTGGFWPDYGLPWTYLRETYHEESDTLAVDYRVDLSNSYLWITLELARDGHSNGQQDYYIRDIFNHYYGLSLTEYFREFNQLVVDNRDLAQSQRKRGAKPGDLNFVNKLTSAYQGGEELLWQFANLHKLDLANPTLYSLMTYLAMENDRFSNLGKQILKVRKNPGETSSRFPFQQFLLNIASYQDDATILKSIEQVERITGDKAWAKSYWASELITQGKLELAMEMSKESLLSDPSLMDTYLNLALIFSKQKKYEETVTVLNTIQHRFQMDLDATTIASIPEFEQFIASQAFKSWSADM